MELVAEENKTEEFDLIAEMESDIDAPEETIPKSKFYYWDKDQNEIISMIAEEIKRMGFELSNYDENLKHVYSARKWQCTLSPKSTCVRLDYLQPTGKMFSECVISYLDHSPKKIVEMIAEVYFNKEV